MKTIGLTLATLLILPVILIRLDAQQRSDRNQKVEDDAGEPIKVDVDVVNLYCAVRNKQNALISNLEKGDFNLAEDGAAQTIKYFTRETDLPLTIGLLVDVSNSQRNLIEIERRAAAAFFSSVLKKKDVAFLISFGADSELLQDITGSPRALQEGLDRMKLNGGFSGINSGPVPTTSKPRGTVLYDAVYLAANDMLAKEVGRKAIVLITDGDDQGSTETEKAAIEAAQKADAIIYGILYVDRQFYGGFGGGYSRRRLAEAYVGRNRRAGCSRWIERTRWTRSSIRSSRRCGRSTRSAIRRRTERKTGRTAKSICALPTRISKSRCAKVITHCRIQIKQRRLRYAGSMPQVPSDHAEFLYHDVYLPVLKNEHGITRRIIEAIPIDQGDYRPDGISKSALDLAWHITVTEMRFMEAMAAGAFDLSPRPRPDSIRNSQDLAGWYTDNFEPRFEGLTKLSKEQILKIIDFRGILQQPALMYVNFLLHHSIHHRGQLSMYLRPMGAKVPSIYGESYDAAEARKAAQQKG